MAHTGKSSGLAEGLNEQLESSFGLRPQARRIIVKLPP